MALSIDQAKRILEAALLFSSEPISVKELAEIFNEEDDVNANAIEDLLAVIMDDFRGRGIELVKVASGYRFQICEDMSPWVTRMMSEKPTRYSRALLETLALVAYKQPITRAEIEQVRGVAVSSNIVRTLQEREWIKVIGHRDVPGKPALYATTKRFLDDLNLTSLSELPTLAEIQNLDDGQLTQQLDLGLGDLATAPESEPVEQTSNELNNDTTVELTGENEETHESESATQASQVSPEGAALFEQIQPEATTNELEEEEFQRESTEVRSDELEEEEFQRASSEVRSDELEEEEFQRASSEVRSDELEEEEFQRALSEVRSDELEEEEFQRASSEVRSDELEEEEFQRASSGDRSDGLREQSFNKEANPIERFSYSEDDNVEFSDEEELGHDDEDDEDEDDIDIDIDFDPEFKKSAAHRAITDEAQNLKSQATYSEVTDHSKESERSQAPERTREYHERELEQQREAAEVDC